MVRIEPLVSLENLSNSCRFIGVAHADDIFLLFRNAFTPALPPEDLVMLETWIDLLTSFAIDG